MSVNMCGMGRPKCRVIPWAPSVCGGFADFSAGLSLCLLRPAFLGSAASGCLGLAGGLFHRLFLCSGSFCLGLAALFGLAVVPASAFTGWSFARSFPVPQRSLPFWLRSFSRLIGLVRCGLAGALGGHFKIQGAHGRQGDRDALLKPVHRLFVGAHGLVVDCAGTAELCIVAVQISL